MHTSSPSRPRILDLASCPDRKVILRLTTTSFTPTTDLQAVGLALQDRYIGSPALWHWSRMRKRWFPCIGPGHCLPCRDRALRRYVRFELPVLIDKGDGTLEERRIFVSPSTSRDFADIAADIEKAGRDPRETPIEWKEDRST